VLLFALRLDGERAYLADLLPATLLAGTGVGLGFAAFGNAAVAELPRTRFATGAAISAKSAVSARISRQRTRLGCLRVAFERVLELVAEIGNLLGERAGNQLTVASVFNRPRVSLPSAAE
jgi:hypothetical protein